MESRILIVWAQMPKLQQNTFFIGQVLCLGQGFLVIHLLLGTVRLKAQGNLPGKICSSGCEL